MAGVTRQLLARIKEKAADGDYLILPHAIQRGLERQISDMDITHALVTGEHESHRDVYRSDFRAWNRAIKGHTIDGRLIRVVVSFDEDYMIIITVFPLGRSSGK